MVVTDDEKRHASLPMPRPKRRMAAVLMEARRVLGMSQRALGAAVEASHRTAGRWERGQSWPADFQLQELAKLLHPHDRALAAEVAHHASETLESLGLEAPQAPREDLSVDAVLLAAVEHCGVTPAVARTWLYAIFKRAHDVGMTMEAAERGFRPAAKQATRPEKADRADRA
jgi:DNA-binding XRE family transcriptional regulator